MAEKTIFKKIIDGEIPADIVYQDDKCLAFRDVNPQAPTHILVIPRQEIQSLAHVDESDTELVGHLFVVVKKLAAQLGLTDGYRTVLNCGKHGGQTVDHMHVHLIGGRPMSWPPG